MILKRLHVPEACRRLQEPAVSRQPLFRSMAKRAGATVVECNGSHAIYVSKPEAVAAIIKSAAAT